MSLLLSPEVPINGAVPKEYNMQITSGRPANTFIFSEKDLPGYIHKTKGNTRQNQHSAEVPPRPQSQDRSKQGSSRSDKTKKWEPYYRKAIPSKFGLTGPDSSAKGVLHVQRRLLSSVKCRKRSIVFLSKTTITTGSWTRSPVEP